MSLTCSQTPHSARFADCWGGLRPATPDALPVLGPDSALPGLIHASGHFRTGGLLALITAAVIARLVGERPTAAYDGVPFDLAHLCPTRFAA